MLSFLALLATLAAALAAGAMIIGWVRVVEANVALVCKLLWTIAVGAMSALKIWAQALPFAVSGEETTRVLVGSAISAGELVAVRIVLTNVLRLLSLMGGAVGQRGQR